MIFEVDEIHVTVVVVVGSTHMTLIISKDEFSEEVAGM